MANCWVLLELWIISLSCSILPSWPSLKWPPLVSPCACRGHFYCHQLPLGNHRRLYSHAGGTASKLKRWRMVKGTRYLLWEKQCHLYHPWLRMVNISPIYLWWNWACDIVFPTSENYTDMPSGNLNLTMEIIRIIRALMCDFAIKPVISHVGLGVPCHIDPWKLWLWRWAAELKHRVST